MVAGQSVGISARLPQFGKQINFTGVKSDPAGASCYGPPDDNTYKQCSLPTRCAAAATTDRPASAGALGPRRTV